jgi:diguanylate cyclase (GGDEF)-like protein
MTSPKKVLIISADPSSQDEIGQCLQKESRLDIQTAESCLQAVDQIYSDPPDLVIVSHSLKEEGWKELCARIKTDPVFGHLPVVLTVKPDWQDSEIDWEDLPIDDYFQEPFTANDIVSRVSLVFSRAARVRDANPLTRLPGNFTIMKEIQRCVDSASHFEVAYLDLDHFKSYNDKYGFLRGDDIIKITARLLTNAARKLDSPEAFVGHVGGDDFVFIVPPEKMERVCQEIIGNFDLIVENFYDEQDKIRGYIDSTNRKGEKESFPFVSVSIAIVTNERRPIKHIGEVSAIAAELKKKAKAMPGSSYYKDSRGPAEE